MFLCQKCNRQSKIGEKGEQVVTEKRPKKYEHKIQKKRSKHFKIIERRGWEIAKEERWCQKCFSEKKKNDARIIKERSEARAHNQTKL